MLGAHSAKRLVRHEVGQTGGIDEDEGRHGQERQAVAVHHGDNAAAPLLREVRVEVRGQEAIGHHNVFMQGLVYGHKRANAAA